MKTCRTLYQEGPSRLLGLRLWLYQPPHIPASDMVHVDVEHFAAYMALHPSYFKYVKDVGFIIPSNEVVSSSMIILSHSLLEHASNMDTLHFEVHAGVGAGNLFPRSPLSCRNLQHLSIHGFNDETGVLLKNIVAPLKTLEVSTEEKAKFNIIAEFASFAVTLEELRASIFPSQIKRPLYCVIYPRIHLLSLSVRRPRIGLLIEAFLNLTSLYLHPDCVPDIVEAYNDYNGGREDEEEDEGNGSTEREAPVGIRYGFWSQLDLVDSNVLTLYGSYRACGANRMRLAGYTYESSLAGLCYTILRTARPRILQVKLLINEYSSLHECMGDVNMKLANQMFGYPGLTHLTLVVQSQVNIDNVRRSIGGALELSHYAKTLIYLRICIDFSNSNEVTLLQNSSLHIVEIYNHQALARSVAITFRSLEYFVVNFERSGGGWSQTYGWKIVGRRMECGNRELAKINDSLLEDLTTEECRRLNDLYG
ncbi:hypothetical protein C8Q75DRAFT_806466 [Abortiporus biennis]|nr:hypothetical protein C8Q75DRAFT_806466 [Abortiporus biennis]